MGRPIARINFRQCGALKMWTYWTLKVDLVNLIHLNPHTKTQFLAHFVTNSRPFVKFGDFGWCIAPRLATGLVVGKRLTVSYCQR